MALLPPVKPKVDVKRGQRAPGRPAILIDRIPNALSRKSSPDTVFLVSNRDVCAWQSDFVCDRMQAIDRKILDTMINNDDEQFHKSTPVLVQGDCQEIGR